MNANLAAMSDPDKNPGHRLGKTISIPDRLPAPIEAPAVTPPVIERQAFDYTALPADVATIAQDAAGRIRQRIDASILDTGRDLLAVKERLEHGQFGGWIEAEFTMSARTAERYINAAKFADSLGKNDIVSVLPATTIQLLAAPSTPREIQDAVIQRAEAGKRVTAADLKQMLQEKKEADRKAAQEAKLTPKQKKTRAEKEAERERERKEYEVRNARMDAAAKAAIDFLVGSLALAEAKTLSTLLKKASFRFRENDLIKALDAKSQTVASDPDPEDCIFGGPSVPTTH